MKDIAKYSIIGLFIFIFAMGGILILKDTNSITTSLVSSNDKNTFSVVLSNKKDTIDENHIIPKTNPSNITATPANISTTIISGINITFTESNQKVTYKLFAHNNGTSNAYLKGIISGRLICTPGENTTIEDANKYCSGVSLTIKTSKEKSFSTTNIDGSLININNHQLLNNPEEINIIIESSSTSKEKGQFNIMVPTISLIYYSNN